MKRSRMGLLAALCCTLASLCSSAFAEPLFKANDRIVFYGDSITEQRLYTRYIQQYLLIRYPDMKLTFVNAGWGGDTAPGGNNRLERDVLVHNPTLVTLFFGMNDGRYTTVNEGHTNAYRDGMDKLVSRLKEKGVRVVVFTPGCVDYDRRDSLSKVDYNKTLAGLGKVGEEIAKKYDVPFGNVIEPMLDFQTKQKAANKSFTMIPDAVHPSPAGHLVMAHIMLKILGAEPMPSYGTLDASTGQGTGLKVASKTTDSWVINPNTACSPFWIEPSSMTVAKDSGMLDFVSPKFAAKGLADSPYAILNSKGASIGRFSVSDLSTGIVIPVDGSEAGKPLHDLIQFKEDNYLQAWRRVRLPLANTAGADEAYKAMLESDKALGNLIQNLAKPDDKYTITLAAMTVGGNLALKCKYESSNPNTFNWGIGGLTDGSWVGNSPTCFATGDSPTFPKNATVDLGSNFKINSVTFGVPAFGSTKTVKVSISKDGKDFTEVGSYQFSQNKEERTTVKFDPTEARYVRLTYVDKYNEQVGYPSNFAFTTELEVYGPSK